MSKRLELSVIVATDASDGVPDTLMGYRDALDGMGLNYECVCVVDGSHDAHLKALQALADDWPELTVIGQRPWGGEDAALSTGVRRTVAPLILLLPGWPEVVAEDLPRLFDALGQADLVSAVRSDRPVGGLRGWRNRLFGRTLDRLFGNAPSDPFCRVRLIRREPLDYIASFGVRQHFLPVIATQRGYVLDEAELRPAPPEAAPDATYVFKPLGHMRALFDAVTLYVVLNFLRRPLRFFGSIGLPVFLAGVILTTVLVLQRLFGEAALADRPALIFGIIMVVLGIQVIAIGLVGEIIIYAGSRRLKQYEVREIIHGGETRRS
ncbi:glycosyltransferase [Marinibacterium sp. SX1]|uniref:glycosyltransferase n=1 Tax=Marinibacterium sp. SX1 TaxID=3388424 RepID=UPI003D16461F